MRRREVFAALGGAAAWPVSASAQNSGKGPLIGFLFYGAPGNSPEIKAFQQGLAELNYIEGQNIRIAYRYAAGEVAKLPNLAAELAGLRPDVIVTLGTPAAVAAKHATSTIPIVIAGVADAVAAGLVAKLAPSA